MDETILTRIFVSITSVVKLRSTYMDLYMLM
jgi:hypothetical protein